MRTPPAALAAAASLTLYTSATAQSTFEFLTVTPRFLNSVGPWLAPDGQTALWLEPSWHDVDADVGHPARVVRWDQGQGISYLPAPEGVTAMHGVRGSLDASSFSLTGSDGQSAYAFHYASQSGYSRIQAPAGWTAAIAAGISDDGLTVHGTLHHPDNLTSFGSVFRWRLPDGGTGAASTMTVLTTSSVFDPAGVIPGSWDWDRAVGTAGDGTLIFSDFRTEGNVSAQRMTAWRPDGTLVNIPIAPHFQAGAVNRTGLVISASNVASNFAPTADGLAYTPAPAPSDDNANYAWLDADAAGRIQVGYMQGSGVTRGAIWIDGGTHLFRDWLITQNIWLESWEIEQATSISDDGRVIMGTAFNYATQQWGVYQLTIPAPATALILPLFFVRRRRN